MKGRSKEIKETKKQLREQIAILENRLADKEKIERINAYIKEAGLPKCESEICVTCVYASKKASFGGPIVLGCTKNLECDHYTPEKQFVVVQEYPMY